MTFLIFFAVYTACLSRIFSISVRRNVGSIHSAVNKSFGIIMAYMTFWSLPISQLIFSRMETILRKQSPLFLKHI